MSNLSPREESIVEAARLLPQEHRSAYLDKLCGPTGPERERVEMLLAGPPPSSAPSPEAHQPANRGTIVLELPALEKAGDRIGPYKLLQLIGEGGCGAVYMAEQEQPVRRRVAVKVIKLGMDTRSVIARFEAERQALALMDHPNIAKVLDAGTTELGRPFFVMELIRGIKITDYCDQNKLAVRERLELFMQVCHAIQHAHQKGVIHRDIKPSNILVTLHDGVTVPKVIDFGIAKARDQRLTDKTLFTQFEQIIGTPAYMSPEQAEMSSMDIDTRSDIYSLGVLLYELLTGRTPFDPKELMQAGLDAMRRTIREKDPQTPSSLLTTLTQVDLATTARQHRSDAPKFVNLIKGDLDWIVMKCLEKDRTRRYETASELAMDAQRFLHDEAILARPPSQWYRLQKMISRNKTTFAAAAMVAAALFLGMAGCLYLYLQERDAHRRALAAEQEQSRLREKAEVAVVLEGKLRREAELKTRYMQAGTFLSDGKFDEAEKLVGDDLAGEEGVAFYNVFTLVYASQGDWLRAVKYCRLLTKYASVPNSPLLGQMPNIYHALAPLLVQTTNVQEYAELRRRILKEFGDTTNAVVAERMAKDCLVLPPEADQLETLRGMADRAVRAGPDHGSWLYFQFVKGLAEYRCGRYAESLNWLQPVAAITNDLNRTAQAHATLAMARFKLGQTNLAEADLANGRSILETQLAAPTRKRENQAWTDWVIARSLVQEAGQVAGKGP